MKDLQPHETNVIGRWREDGLTLKPDDNCIRISYLVDNVLIPIASNDGGWTRLFRNPNDGRLWELTYPESELHGGGPPSLINIAKSEVIAKYGDIV